ncbi:MAG: tripartite tricarboxylate transporter TctB family protein [Syntrophales bacterium]
MATSDKGKTKKQAIGADLVIPAMAVAFTIYYFSSIWGLNWEASANGLAIGAVLLLLIGIFLVRTALQLKRGEATLAMDKLLKPMESRGRRLGLIAAIIAFIVFIPYLGLTLAMFLFMCATMLVLGVRKPLPLLATALTVAAGAYVGFIAILNTRFPHGPVETILARILG